MATVEQIGAEDRVVLYGISWRTYLELRDEPENEHLHMTYDRGTLEIMSPSCPHETFGHTIGRLLDVWTEELEIPIRGLGTMTCSREDLDRGFEPDKCYYVQNQPQVWNKKTLDFTVDPPPDLAIEVEVTRSTIKKLAVYAAFGVPEVWRFDGHRLQVYEFVDGSYQPRESSRCLPQFPLAEVERLLEQVDKIPETTLIVGFRAWVRKTFMHGDRG